MAFEHQPSRLTAEEQQLTINLAAILQARHEETLGVDELAEIAKEAGLRPEFVYEAVRVQNAHLENARPGAKDLAALYGLTVGLVLLNILFTFNFAVREMFISSAAVFLLLFLAAVTGFRRGQAWRTAWVGPVVLLLAFAVTQGIYVAIMGRGYDGPNTSAAGVLGWETGIATAVAFFSVLGGILNGRFRREL
jgi:hypothetical protein